MEFFGHLARCLTEIATLVRMLITNGLRFMTLYTKSRAALTAENLFLRKQLAFYQERKVAPRRFDNASRYLLVLLTRWFAWKEALVNVTPKTLIGWRRAGFRLFWRWKCRRGRPPIPPELRALIRQMARDNMGWGEERIANELLLKLRIRVSPRTVRKYMPKRPRSDQRWSTFLRNHAKAIVVCDFFNEAHLSALLQEWKAYYNGSRVHSSLGPSVPDPPTYVPALLQSKRHRIGKRFRVIAKPMPGGLHHDYALAA